MIQTRLHLVIYYQFIIPQCSLENEFAYKQFIICIDSKPVNICLRESGNERRSVAKINPKHYRSNRDNNCK